MSKYISRHYLREKWDALKWDMEKVLDVYNEEKEDNVADEADRVSYEMIRLMEALKSELSK